MNAKKCDKCGKFYEHYSGRKRFCGGEQANAILFVDRDSGKDGYYSRILYDFCPECMSKLQEWLKGDETNG